MIKDIIFIKPATMEKYIFQKNINIARHMVLLMVHVTGEILTVTKQTLRLNLTHIDMVIMLNL